MKQNKLILFIVWILIVLMGLRFIPYILWGVPLGYDPGFYKAFFDAYFANIPFFSYATISPWINNMYEPFLWYFSIILQSLWFSVNVLLWYGLPFFSIITAGFIYLVLKPYDKKIAIIWAWLFLISIIQYGAFWWFYYKQILWIIFILTVAYLIHKWKFYSTIPILIWALTLQRPTGVFILGTIIVYILWSFLFTKKYSKALIFSTIIAWIIATIFYLPLFNTLILPFIQPISNSIFLEWTSWTFFSLQEYFLYAWPYLSLGIIWLIIRLKYKTFDVMDAGFIFGLLRVGLRLYFYNRMIIFLDIFSILLSAWALRYFLKNQRGKYLLICFFARQTTWYLSCIYTKHTPLATSEELKFLSSLSYVLPKWSLLICNDSNYTPRTIGYAKMPVMAPWLLDRDPWIKEERIERRLGNWKKKCDMLRKANIQKNNVYMYIGSNQQPIDLKDNDCFKIINANSWYYLFSVNLDKNDKK